jgi:hypothetical protein
MGPDPKALVGVGFLPTVDKVMGDPAHRLQPIQQDVRVVVQSGTASSATR